MFVSIELGLEAVCFCLILLVRGFDPSLVPPSFRFIGAYRLQMTLCLYVSLGVLAALCLLDRKLESVDSEES